MAMNREWMRIWDEIAVVYLNVLSQYSFAEQRIMKIQAPRPLTNIQTKNLLNTMTESLLTS